MLAAAFILAWGPRADTQEMPPLYPVFITGKYGYIDKAGKVVIAPQFDRAGSFSEEAAVVEAVIRTNGTYARKSGYINKAGNIIIPAVRLGWTI